MMTTEPVSGRRQQTLDRLQAAAIEVFAEHGIEAASVEEICERAGFTRGAFYSNFDSKEELCLAIVRQQSAALLAAIREGLAEIPPATIHAGSLDEIVSKVLALVNAAIGQDQTWVVVRAELRLYAYRNPSFSPALLAAEHEVSALLNQAVGEALERQRASTTVPLGQLMVTLDAYRERARLEEIIAADGAGGSEWSLGLERLIRALVAFPDTPAQGADG